MWSRITTGVLPIVFLMAYATLMTGGKLPTSNWQLAVVVCQSLLMTILTSYLGWTSMRLCKTQSGGGGDAGQDGTADSTALLNDGIQQLPCAILLVSASNERLLFANQSALKMFAIDWMPHSQLMQRELNELVQFVNVGGKPTDCDEGPIAEAAKSRKRTVAEDVGIRQPNGEIKRVSVTAVPLVDAQDECTTIMVLVQDLTDYHLQLQRIKDVAYVDALTGLPNRLSILRRMQEAFDRKDSSNFALLFLDFDRFKLINDSLGHEVGDQLLVQIGQRIRNAIRSTDCVCIPARLGGDEFVVLLDELSDGDVAIQVAERLLQTLGEPYNLVGHSVVSTASIGIVSSDQQVQSATDMLRSADLAMYKSKTSGKARYSVFDESLKREVEQRLQLENELRAAIKYSEFRFDVQSVVHLQTRAVIGGEALLRWQHPKLGRISANQFVDVATESGLIVPLGEQVIRRACQFATELDGGSTAWRLHINISRIQLLLPSLLDLIDKTILETGLAPQRLVLEISEASVKEEPEKVIERLHELKQRNVRVCLDNFGSGASPLAFLKDLPIDFLKLDRSLVHALEISPENCVLLEAIVTIANTYKIEVIAEGIESEAQLKKLSDLGCSFGQGYVFQRPIDTEAYREARQASLSVAMNSTLGH